MAKKDKVQGAVPAEEVNTALDALGGAAVATPEAPAAPEVLKPIHNKKLVLVGSYDPESKITWNTTVNPRSPSAATFARFAKYMGTESVKAYSEAGGTKGDLLWDLRSGFLSIEGVTLSGDISLRTVRVAAPKVPKEKKVKAEKLPKAAKTTEQVELESAVVEETID